LLTLDAGDTLFKKYLNPLLESELKSFPAKAQLIVESLNLMGYDGLGVGDDDLTLGKAFLVEISKKASFPFLSSNILDEETGNLLFQPFLVKETNGLRVGVFSLLSPDVFSGPADPRKKGLQFRPTIETAQAMVKELQPKTDFIILLSHLGYQKDLELAQAVSGIHLILGSHTGINLSYPPVIKSTIVTQLAGKGMYGGKLDLTISNNGQTFYNLAIKRSLETNVRNLKARLGVKEVPETEKVQLRKTLDETEKRLTDLQGKNEFDNRITPLTDQMKDDPEILKMIAAYKAKFPEAPPSPKSSPSEARKPGAPK
jgi:2',3'-cyclic-nucleotide 2'-phosphodiesterase (5'-nucleotidase family)